MTNDRTHPEHDVTTDENWKQRVKAEDAALDQQFRQTHDGSTRTEAPAGRPAASSAAETVKYPEASFDTLLGMLSTQAMVALGTLRNPATGKAETQLPLARHFIDLISVLEQKTSGNLTAEEAAALDETLHHLRMAYVQLSGDNG